MAYPYHIRGYAKIKIGQAVEGFQDLYYSLTLDADNAPFHYILGQFHLEHGENSKALIAFKKAKELDSTTENIDNWILEAEKIEK